MRVEDFKFVIAEWLRQGIPTVREREVKLPLDSSLVVVVTGGRRCGKTSLLFYTVKQIIENGRVALDEILYVDFEHPRLIGVSALDLDEMLLAFQELTGKGPKYIFLDEIQVVKDYGKWFRRRIDAGVFLTGSSSTLTPRKIAEELRGRSVNYEVYPLSFKEYLAFRGYEVKPDLVLYGGEAGAVLSLLKEYLEYGGYPGVVLERDKKRVLRSYFESIVVRDLGGSALSEALALYLASNHSQLISINRVYNYLKTRGFRVGKESVIEMLTKARETYFAFFVELFEKSESKRRVNPKKLYIIDTGYPTALGYEFSISRAMENAVFLELARRGEHEVYHWKEYGKSAGLEVDFVLAKNFEVEELVQVTYAADHIEEREIKALEKAMKTFRPKKARIITWSYRGKLGEIETTPLWYWLLQHR